MRELKASVVFLGGILFMSELVAEKACAQETSGEEAKPAAFSYSLCSSLDYVFQPHSHNDHSPDEPSTTVPFFATGNVAASAESWSTNALQETKREIITQAVTAEVLGRVYSLSALKVLTEFPFLSDAKAQRVFQYFWFNALRMKVCAHVKGEINLSVTALVLGFDHRPRLPPA